MFAVKLSYCRFFSSKLFVWWNDCHIFEYGRAFKRNEWHHKKHLAHLHHRQPITILIDIKYFVCSLMARVLKFNYQWSIHDWKQETVHSSFLLGNGPLKRHHFKCETLIAFTSVEWQMRMNRVRFSNDWFSKATQNSREKTESPIVSFGSLLRFFNFKWLWKLGYDG